VRAFVDYSDDQLIYKNDMVTIETTIERINKVTNGKALNVHSPNYPLKLKETLHLMTFIHRNGVLVDFQ